MTRAPEPSPRNRAGLFQQPPFMLLALILVAVFVVTRIPFFWFYPRVDLSQDSASYLDVANTMRQGHWPRFVFRTPGYPLLICVVTSLVDRWLAVIFVQNVLSLAAALSMAYAVLRARPALALGATAAMCGYLGSSQALFYDISLMRDRLYTNMVILTVAGLILAFARRTVPMFALVSAQMALVILVRPAGYYLFVIYALMLAFMLWNRFSARLLAGFAAPFPCVLLCFCAYNFATLGQFVISPFTEANLAGATALFWETDPRLPDKANKALAGLTDSYEKLGITRKDLDLVRDSWETVPLFDVYAKAYNRLVWSAGWGSGTRFGAGSYLTNRKYIWDVSVMAIRRHPILYAKYVWVNLVNFFEGIGYKFDIYGSLRYRESASLPGDAGALHPDATDAHGAPPAPALDGASRMEAALKRLQLAWQSFHGMVFQNLAWSWAYLGILAASFARLAASRWRHEGAFLLLVLSLIPLGAALVVCLVEVALDRYSYATQFICYLLVALLPLLGASGADLRARRKPADGPAA